MNSYFRPPSGLAKCTDPCAMSGSCFGTTTCNAFNSDVKSINLASLGMAGAFPKALASFPHLASANLGGNSFDGSLPSEMCDLPDLRELDLSGNSFSGAIPECFGTTDTSDRREYVLLKDNNRSNEFQCPIPVGATRTGSVCVDAVATCRPGFSREFLPSCDSLCGCSNPDGSPKKLCDSCCQRSDNACYVLQTATVC